MEDGVECGGRSREKREERMGICRRTVAHPCEGGGCTVGGSCKLVSSLEDEEAGKAGEEGVLSHESECRAGMSMQQMACELAERRERRDGCCADDMWRLGWGDWIRLTGG